MELLFRRFPTADPLPPKAGEIHVRPQAIEHKERRDYATLVLQGGAKVFACGPGPTRCIVVNAEPTLDDLLAAAFLKQLLAGQKLPDGCKAYARYTALVREGLKPSSIALEQSLEGIFLALRTAYGSDLSDAADSSRFAADWSRMAKRLLAAAKAGMDPFTSPLFSADANFARERDFLAKDRDAFRQDVDRGEQWQVAIPGGPSQASALLLKQPQSKLFKYWSRRVADGPDGQNWLLLAVAWGGGQWVFSTDPLQRLPLKPLAEGLQAAEQHENLGRAQADPWFDGKHLQHHIIAAPKGGTALTENKVLRIVKQWTGAKPSRRTTFTRKALYLAPAAVLLLAVGLTWMFASGFGGGRSRGWEENPPGPPNAGPIDGTLHVLTIGISKYADTRFKLDFAHADAEALADVFKKQSRGVFKNARVKTLINEAATREGIVEALAALKKDGNLKPNDMVVVSVSGHGAHYDDDEDFFILPYDFSEPRKATTGVYWSDFKRHLEKLPCLVFLVMDTCHSGSITKDPAIRRGVTDLSQQKGSRGMVIMAACLSGEKASERNDWQHGALTLALLEGLQRKHLYLGNTQTRLPDVEGDKQLLNLKELDFYVTKRVRDLAGKGQAVITAPPGDLDMQSIHIASIPGGSN